MSLKTHSSLRQTVEATSLLFVPGDRPERFAKAAAAGADQVIIDLEDAVRPDAKSEARSAAARWFSGGGGGVMRINVADTQWHLDDIALARLPAVDAIMLPKAEDPARIAALYEATGKPIVALIETARGLDAVKAVAASPGVTRLAFGSIDLCLDLGLDVADPQLDGFRLALVLASRLADLPGPIDGVQADFRDTAGLSELVSRVRGLGYTAKLCIHPNQVTVISAGFSPTADEIDWARRVVAMGEGAAALEGQMIDRPVRERAIRLLDRANARADEPPSVSA